MCWPATVNIADHRYRIFSSPLVAELGGLTVLHVDNGLRAHRGADRPTRRTTGDLAGERTPRPEVALVSVARWRGFLITGMSGSGKTTVLDELRRRGHFTVDTDYGGWVQGDGTWDEPRMAALLRDNEHVYVAGTVENQGRFYEMFDHVVLLSAPLDVLLERVASRTNNPYGKTAAQRAEIEHNVVTVEPLLRAGAAIELDGQRPPGELADRIEGLSGRPAR